MYKISVIVAIYKVERYLEQCLESITKQTYDNLEIILVDDGSPDKCPIICDQFSLKDERVRVIHQENQGAMKTRWNGVMEAQGDYISFIDGDDWLEPNMYKEMIQHIYDNSVDIVVTGYVQGENADIKRNNIASGIYTGEKLKEIQKKIIYFGPYYEPGIIPALWNKLFKRELLLKKCMPADLLIKMGDDASVSYPALAKSDCIVIDNEVHSYHYRVVQNSMSRSYDDKYFERALVLINSLRENLSENEVMNKQLVYYSLFISQIGIEQILSWNCKLPYWKKINIIKNYRNRYILIDFNEDVLWEDFDDYSKKVLNFFLEGNIGKLLNICIVHKILERIGILEWKRKILRL